MTLYRKGTEDERKNWEYTGLIDHGIPMLGFPVEEPVYRIEKDDTDEMLLHAVSELIKMGVLVEIGGGECQHSEILYDRDICADCGTEIGNTDE